MRVITCIWPVIVMMLLTTAECLSQSIYLPHYTTKNGLPSNNCYFTLQDKKGYIWVATDAGVSRFDGSIFENFTVDDGLPDNQIIQLREDHLGRIWFLSLNGQLSFFLNGKIHHPNNDKILSQLNFNAVIVSFYEDTKGNIWLGTNKNIIGLWNGKTLRKFSSPNNERQYINAYLTEDDKGNIWAYNNYGSFQFSGKNFTEISDQALPVSYKTIIRNTDKSVYLLTKKGLYLKKGNTNQFIANVDPELISNSPGYIHVNDNELWLVNNSGVFVVDEYGNTQQFLKDVDVNQAVKDRQNNIWFTTKNGIYRLPEERERLYIFNNEQGLSNNIVKSLTKDNRNHLWLGLSDGKINRLDLGNNRVTAFDIPDKKKYNNIKQVLVSEKDNKLYFSSDYGLGTFDLGMKVPKINFLTETNNSVFVIKNFCLDQSSKLALSLSSGVVILNDRSKLEFSTSKFRKQQDFFADRSYRVFYDSKQNLWFANISGLSEFSPARLSNHYNKNKLLTKRINDIKELAGDTLALATDGYGILLFNHGKVVQHITLKKGLNNNIINKLFVKDNDLWAISNTGINRIKFINGKTEIKAFDYANELLSDDLNDIYVDENAAYFATNNGLVYFLHNQRSGLNARPKIYISSILNNKAQIDLSTPKFTLEPGEHNIIFNYSAIDFKNQKITYRYRLKAGANWTETKNRRLELSSLEAGEYLFEVSAKSQDGQWSEPAKVSFELKKHFWQTWSFLVTAILIGAFVLYKLTVKITRTQKNKEQQQLLLKNKILMLEQKALQAMMNPHFVFNIMNSIQHYINTKNTSSANKVLTGFAKLIRKNLDIITKSNISLDEEIAYLNLYLRLEKYRFGDKLNYDIHIAEDLDKDEVMIPSMLLQPYIENAIWHGIMPKEEGGMVKIKIFAINDTYLQIEIIDDGIGIDNSYALKKTTHESKGMTLTNDRINLLNQIEAKPIQLSIRQNEISGTTVTIKIPF